GAKAGRRHRPPVPAPLGHRGLRRLREEDRPRPRPSRGPGDGRLRSGGGGRARTRGVRVARCPCGAPRRPRHSRSFQPEPGGDLLSKAQAPSGASRAARLLTRPRTVGPRGGILEGGAVVKVILETTRLFLRELSLADLDFAAEMRADPEVMRYYPRYYSRDETEAWVRKQIDLYHTQNHALWLAVDRDTLQPVGHVGLVRQLVDGVEEREVGY